MELWCIWVSGFALIGVSLYSIQRLPPLINNGVSDLSNPIKITIFSAPRPFSGSLADTQTLAVRSWLALSPHLTVVLFSQHSSVFSFARSFGSRVFVDPNIDFTFLGTPFFHSIMARSYNNSFESDISVLVNPQAVLFSDFISALNYAYELDHDWLLVASLRNQHKDPNLCKGEKLMAWNNGDLPLHSAVLPPFLYGRGVHHNWVLTEALSSGFRFVFDASLAISSLHNDNDDDRRGSNGWEYDGNSILGTLYGSAIYRNFNRSELTILVKLRGGYRFHRIRGDEISDCSLMERSNKDPGELDFGFSLESLLPIMADENRTIVVAVSGYSYKDMLMSWVCRLRRLNVTNFIVFALDHEMYRFSILQGLPVFNNALAPSYNISFDDCHFGTKCFKRVTKVKSRTVLEILKMGYNVLLSDVDVYWFKNPLPFLSSFGPSVLAAQSDEYNQTGPINMPRRLNSGFYFARADVSTIAAMEKVVKHAEDSGLSEQPSFYDTLCGENGTKRVGDDRCFDPGTNLTVRFLDRDLFPNGAYRDIWRRTKKAGPYCEKTGCFVLHNNWINGRRKKLERQLSSGLWEYDTTTRMCLQS